VKKLNLTDKETARLGAALTKLAWVTVRPWLVAKAINRLTGRDFGYVDAMVLEFLITNAGSMMESGRRSEAEIDDAVHGV
jgi:hypothetical protein